MIVFLMGLIQSEEKLLNYHLINLFFSLAISN